MTDKDHVKELRPAEIDVPDGVQAELAGKTLSVTGEKGALTRTFKSPRVLLATEDGKIVVSTKTKRRQDRAITGTVAAHVKNMIAGVREGYVYRLKIVYAHFPMNVKVQGDHVVIDNFLGEKHPRKSKIFPGVSVDIKGQDVTVSGADKELVAQTAATLEQTTRIKNLDPRIFQDGIYLTEKNGKPLAKAH